MDQKETLELYAKAEAARAAAKDEGKDDDTAHAAATAVWNGWAETMLGQRAKLEAAGKWSVSDDVMGSPEPLNKETEEWLGAARLLFSDERNKYKFKQHANCQGWRFPSEVVMVAAEFVRGGTFDGTTFEGAVRFDGVTLAGAIRFAGAEFARVAEFSRATFSGDVSFSGASFAGEAWFDRAKFEKTARFTDTMFGNMVWFDRATFADLAMFDRTAFEGAAKFSGATFTSGALFHAAEFADEASFGRATFSGGVHFDKATFSKTAQFDFARFDSAASFVGTEFESGASFLAITGTSAFNLERARFRLVPDFIQASFSQAPRLDNVRISLRLLAPPQAQVSNSKGPKQFIREVAGRSAATIRNRLVRPYSAIPARYRALKRLAIQGHDLEREQMFHAGEIRASRFATDWPLHYKLWSSEGWASIGRFWFGLFYGGFSDFGRSWVRPALAWLALLVASFAIYLGANPELAQERAALLKSGSSTAWAYTATTQAAWSRDHPCVTNGSGMQGLPEPVRNVTTAVIEARRFALMNAFVVGDIGSPDAAARSFGCLYGIVPSGDARPPVVPYPAIVADWAMVQRLLSALFIFLFGLAVRNMLKLK